MKGKSDRNPIADEALSSAEELFAKACNAALGPRSLEYKRGVMAALIHRATGIKPKVNCPYKEGTVGFDAFGAGLEEGYHIWRRHIKVTMHPNQATRLSQE